jgi:hypothetical protein
MPQTPINQATYNDKDRAHQPGILIGWIKKCALATRLVMAGLGTALGHARA